MKEDNNISYISKLESLIKLKESEERIMGELSKLPNIGDKLEAQLNEVGVKTVAQLKEIGSKQAWMDIKAIDTSACINRLCALEGAIQGMRWHNLSKEVKDELKEFYSAVK